MIPMVESNQETTGKQRVVTMIPQPHGGALRDRGPGIAGPGRPPDAFKRYCAELAHGGTENVGRIARGEPREGETRRPTDAEAVAAWRALADKGFDSTSTTYQVTVGSKALLTALPDVLESLGVDGATISEAIRTLGAIVKRAEAQ